MTPAFQDDFLKHLSRTAGLIDAALDTLLAPEATPNVPDRLLNAMRHATLNGGKRIRPFLVLECAALFGAPQAPVVQLATALECIHSYSLVHDDLPDMDNDDVRRGQPTVHKAFDPATAILVGDGLLTLGFEQMVTPWAGIDPATQLALSALLAQASGCAGMIGGQLYDLAAEGRFDPRGAVSESDIARIQRLKTGALLTFACQAGAMLGNADEQQLGQLASYGSAIGLAFQIQDDVLDRTASAAALGKATGKDQNAGKATFVDLYGLAGARDYATTLVGEAVHALASFGSEADMLRALAHYIAQRQN